MIASKIISTHQRGFIPGRHISNCVIVTSEAINILSKKCFAGDIALKIDIQKAFDTIDWLFFMYVLRKFGFGNTFCDWISEILHSARLSVLVNGRGAYPVHLQGNDGRCFTTYDPCRGMQVPSHVLYADDIMIFCKALKKNIKQLLLIFKLYGQASGQLINHQKSKFYVGSISNARMLMLSNLFGFTSGSLPFIYLGCPIFMGKPKSIHLCALADKIKTKLATWKGSFISITGRVQLVRSIIHGMLTDSLQVYLWPISLLNRMEKWIRNFIWSGEVNTRMICIVSWKTVCLPYEVGGLDLCSLRKINTSLLLLLCWKFLSSNDDWARLCRARFLRARMPAAHFIRSSVWPGIKPHISTVQQQSRWLIGSGDAVLFWSDNWLGDKLLDLLHIPTSLRPLLQGTVRSFTHNHLWRVPHCIVNDYPDVAQRINKIVLPTTTLLDRLVLYSSKDGELKAKQANDFLFSNYQSVSWAHCLWSSAVPPSVSFVYGDFSYYVTSAPRLKVYTSNAPMEQQILQHLHLAPRLRKAPQIKLVLWKAPNIWWLKANTDGSVVSNTAACGGLFRDHLADHVGSFAHNLGPGSILHAEITVITIALELAAAHGWQRIWIESDSMGALSSFDNPSIVPWDLRNRWSNCDLSWFNRYTCSYLSGRQHVCG
ncbi:unnamed protein product [Trifolium pratense]|uniref:Uncharacterized protein n=1 Tax=Trifolium pratense TaxID=57577 RepID=A0ACB0KKB2_TRIPR|nr:unnamed protein product [Trifolium pratense]